MWKPIDGFSNYEVNRCGEVRNIKTGRILKLKDNIQHYLSANLSEKGKVYTRTVHRLVAIAFIPNPENKEQVNHKDGNKHNNVVENLEWVTLRENRQHTYKNGLAELPKPVVQLSLEGVFIKEYESLNQACKAVHSTNVQIAKVCNGQGNHSKGYLWRWKNAN